MTDNFDFDQILEILKDLVVIKKNMKAAIPVLTWKYLLFEWNDSDEEIDRAVRLTNEIGLDNITFGLVGFPSPSKRFVRNSDAWNKLKAYK
jgi:hypothetical protein